MKGGFASHLHQALQEAGCRPFLDKPALEKGQPGQKKIYEALGCASVHVAIFSEHYADSDYCLDELCAMLQSNTEALKNHGRSESEVQEWKDALRMAAELNGFKPDDYNR